MKYQKWIPIPMEDIAANEVGIFHVARRNDGSIEPVISAYLDPSDFETIQGLLNTSHVQSDYVSHHDDHHLFMFDGNSAKTRKNSRCAASAFRAKLSTVAEIRSSEFPL